MSLQEKIDQMKAQFEAQAPPKSWTSWIRCNPNAPWQTPVSREPQGGSARAPQKCH